MDPTRPTQTTPSQGGKLVYLQEENPWTIYYTTLIGAREYI
jgi:hypothetical protein